MRRRLLLALALLVVVAGGLAVAYLELRHRAPTVEGSTTREYVPPTRTAPPPRPREPGVAWPTYGFDAQRTRFAPGLRLRPPFRRVWTFHGRALLEFPPVVAYGRVYQEIFDGRLVALDARTGAPLWRYRSDRCGWGSPAVDGDVVYAAFIGNYECGSKLGDGQVLAFAARTGRIRWARKVGPTESSPLVADGAVYVGDWNGRVWALDARTGRTRWTFDGSGAIKGSLALSGRRLYIGSYGGDLYCLDARSGRLLWRSGGHGPFYSSPAVSYGRVYIGSLDGGVYAFGAGTGHLLWARPTGGYVYASPAVWQGLVLVGSYDHGFYAFDAGTGSVRWRFGANGPISGAASVVDGVVYFSSFAEETYALDAANGRVLERWPDGKYSPVVADPQRLYLVGQGRLYALVTRR